MVRYKLKVNQVAAFLAAVEHGSFAKAAEQLGMKRGTLSATIAAFEDELNTELFTRTGNSLQITVIGEQLLDDAKRLVRSGKRIEQICQQFRDGVERELKIARDDSLPETVWHECMAQLRKKFPQTSVSVYLIPSQEHDSLVSSGNIDIAFGIYKGVEPEFRLAVVEQKIVVHPSHPLAQLKSVSDNDLKQYTQICLAYLEHGKLVNSSRYGNQYLGLTMYELMQDAVIRGDGWAILPLTLIEEKIKSGSLKPISCQHPAETIDFHCLTNGIQNHVATWLRGYVSNLVLP